jgi:hypothetical protein
MDHLQYELGQGAYMLNRTVIFLSIFLCLSASAQTVDVIFHEDQPLLNRLLIEGVKQRFFNVRIKSLADAIESFVTVRNSWDEPASFKISNQVNGDFEFEGVKAGGFSEPPQCESYEIHFSGSYSENRTDSRWQIGDIEVKFLDRSQCL